MAYIGYYLILFANITKIVLKNKGDCILF